MIYLEPLDIFLICINIEGSRSAKCKVWRASRDADVKNHELGGVIAQSYKGREIADVILHIQNMWQGREVKVRTSQHCGLGFIA